MMPGEDHVGEVVIYGDVPTTAFVRFPTAALAARAVKELDGTLFRQAAAEEEEEEGEYPEVCESTIVVFPDWRIVGRQLPVVLDGVNAECTILEIKKAFGPELIWIEREPDEPKTARVCQSRMNMRIRQSATDNFNHRMFRSSNLMRCTTPRTPTRRSMADFRLGILRLVFHLLVSVPRGLLAVVL